MQQHLFLVVITLTILLIQHSQSHSEQKPKGFPKQFVAILNQTSYLHWKDSSAPEQLVYDFINQRARFDIKGWRAKQNETYMIQYKPNGAEQGSPTAEGYTLFNFNPDYPELTKGNCWYNTFPIQDFGAFPSSWITADGDIDMKPWFPLPNNLVYKGVEWISELQINALRFVSPDICDLKTSGIGKVPCLSYFETNDGTPVKTIQARAAAPFYDTDEYTSVIYLSFINGIPSKFEPLFNLPAQWPSACGNANNGYSKSPVRGFVVTPDGGLDNFTMTLQTPPVHSLGDEVTITFRPKPSWYYNGTECAKFTVNGNPKIVFTKENWNKPQRIDMKFSGYGCCEYEIEGMGGSYEWQYQEQTFVVYGCDGVGGLGCNGKYPCGG
ncbi:unnamed protein product [Rotaria sp. Silwood1]|nr:unnamed protein product [Rotaria sp. Silwood1]CAF1587087.1 unnamed protein product [Rotaria sp. Silwood1]CAF3650721.1 unnamed protein product [Rotaria sp. Silwood1]CAF3689092.1 unnamed protein product [Rotaria sp. Silwood1]CAF3720514.1 unnamed protein product [Rotaria sp. Silwood1]